MLRPARPRGEGAEETEGDAMTEIHRWPIAGPMAWTARELGGKDGLARRLAADELAGLDRLLDATRAMDALAVARADFDHPAVNRLMDEVRATIMAGRGIVILSGYDLGRHTQAEYERVYWGLGTHLGRAAPQSARDDRIGYVQETPSATPRGYLSTLELRPHTDFHEILSLASVRRAAAGGLSGAVSALAIHNVILEERPDLLPALYDGFFYGTVASERHRRPLSATKVPVFSCVAGKVSCMNNGFFMRVAAERLGTDLPSDLVAALDFFHRVSVRDDLFLQFMLEPGEMMFWNNFTQLHARTEFRNSPEQRRLLLRLWLDVADGRPVIREISERARQVTERMPDEVSAAAAG